MGFCKPSLWSRLQFLRFPHFNKLWRVWLVGPLWPLTIWVESKNIDWPLNGETCSLAQLLLQHCCRCPDQVFRNAPHRQLLHLMPVCGLIIPQSGVIKLNCVFAGVDEAEENVECEDLWGELVLMLMAEVMGGLPLLLWLIYQIPFKRTTPHW